MIKDICYSTWGWQKFSQADWRMNSGGMIGVKVKGEVVPNKFCGGWGPVVVVMLAIFVVIIADIGIVKKKKKRK